MSKTRLTEAERQERREADREKTREAIEALRNTAGWKRWLRVRRHFHKYSLANQLLIAMQLPDATRIAGFRAWLKLGYCVRCGEHAIRIWVPMPPRKVDIDQWKANGAVTSEKPRTHFRLGPVFDRSQVEELPPPAMPVALDPPVAEVRGADLAWTYPHLVALAQSVGVRVVVESMVAGRGGYYTPPGKRIGLNGASSVNQRVKTLVHELGHALLHIEHTEADATLTYAEEELVVESVAFTVCGSLGLDTAGFSIPYLTSWSEGAEVETIERAARLIDMIAKRIEESVEPEVVQAA